MVPVRRYESKVYGTSPPPSTCISTSVSTPPRLSSLLPTGIPLQQHPACFTEPRPPTKPLHSATIPRASSPSRCTIHTLTSGTRARNAAPAFRSGMSLLLRRQHRAATIVHGGRKLALAVVVTQLGEESVSLGGMVGADEKERMGRGSSTCANARAHEAEREGKAKEGYEGVAAEGITGNPLRGGSVLSSIPSTPPFSLEARMWVARLCVGGCVSRAVQTNQVDGARYLAISRRLLSRRTSSPRHRSHSGPTLPPSPPPPVGLRCSAAVIHAVGTALVLLPVLQTVAGPSVLERFLACLYRRRVVPRRAVAIVKAHEETVVDGKKTIVAQLRLGRCLWRRSGSFGRKGVWLEGIGWRNAREAEAGVAPCPLREHEGQPEAEPASDGARR
ncbi:hypothetical protein C8R45DRAFT_172961 [Mycena sanguinolenta]|nr:hypothetical protein C8R45DRAFT_172961 [Mycena sanguinolenta]